VGVGFNLDADGAEGAIEALTLGYDQVRSGTQTLSDDQINALLDQTVNPAVQGARQVISGDIFDALSEDRQSAWFQQVGRRGRADVDVMAGTATIDQILSA
jgi:hypothetical protein